MEKFKQTRRCGRASLIWFANPRRAEWLLTSSSFGSSLWITRRRAPPRTFGFGKHGETVTVTQIESPLRPRPRPPRTSPTTFWSPLLSALSRFVLHHKSPLHAYHSKINMNIASCTLLQIYWFVVCPQKVKCSTLFSLNKWQYCAVVCSDGPIGANNFRQLSAHYQKMYTICSLDTNTVSELCLSPLTANVLR